jgi:Protein of unknown function (DUF4232)
MKSRLFLSLTVAVALLAVVPIAAPTAGAAAAAKPCPVSGLVIWAGEEPGGGAAGSVFYRIEFANLSGSSCSMSGYPKVSAVNLHGKRIGAAATIEPAKETPPVKLAPGDTATATLRIVEALNYPTGKCKPTTAAGLRVTVPGGSGSKVAPLAFETCASSASKTLSVGPVTTG